MTTEDLDGTGAILDFLRAEGGDRLGHAGGRTLISHLRGTAELVRRWGQPGWLQRAALLHSVYGTAAYPRRLIPLDRRPAVAAVAGEQAERLAYLFGVTPPRPLLAGTHRWAHAIPGVDATRDELDALVLLHMANLADQASSPGGAPGRWLVALRDLGELLHDSDTITPPACLERLAELTEEDETLARRSYARAARSAEPQRTASLALAVTACPALAEPCVWLAHLAACRGDGAGARAWAEQAHERLLLLATPWDKRLEFEEWQQAIAALRDAAQPPGERQAAICDPRALHRVLTGRRERSRRDTSPAVNGEAGAQRFERYLSGLADAGDAPAGGAYPDLPSRPWHDPSGFPLVADLQAHFPAIRAEILGLDGAAFHTESERIGRTGTWDVAFLYERGRRHHDICEACPVTAEIVEARRTMRSIAGLIYVSRMRPDTHISPHRGPTNLRLRCHLGIAVPEGDCAIRVGTETRRWREGGCLVFDDFYDHEAWNHTETDRIVLIVDLWHPALSDAEVRLLEGLHTYTYRHARRLSRYWAANDAAAGGGTTKRSTWA